MKLLKRLSYLLVLGAMVFQNSIFAAPTGCVNIAFVGNASSGKTQLRSTVTKHEFSAKRKPTDKTDLKEYPLRYMNENKMCRLFDTSGNEKVRNYIITDRLKESNIQIVAITIDASETAPEKDLISVVQESFDKWIKVIRNVVSDVYILVVITKCDQLANLSPEQLKSGCEWLKQAYTRLDYVFTSSMTGFGLGDPNNGDDFGDNFWGKIRQILASGHIRESEYHGEKVDFNNDKDNAEKKVVVV